MWLIYPIVKKIVARIGWIVSIVAIHCAVFSLLEALLFIIGSTFGSSLSLQGGFLFDFVSQRFYMWLLILCGILAPWCSLVLLAKGGNAIIRIFAYMAAFFSLIQMADTLYLLFTGQYHSIIDGQLFYSILSGTMLAVTILAALPYYDAAPRPLKIRLAAVATLLVLVPIATPVPDYPWLVFVQCALKIALCLPLFRIARVLSKNAPHIAGLPE